MVGLRPPRDAARRAHRRPGASRCGATASSTRCARSCRTASARGRTASRALGYAQALAQLDGTMTQERAIAETAQATRRYARRQESWFRPDPRIHWVDPTADGALDDAVAGSSRRSPTMADMTTWRFTKGHGTENDFVLAARRRRAPRRRRRHGPPARRPPRRHRRRRRHPRRAHRSRGRRGRARHGRPRPVVHGLPQRRRVASPRCAATAPGSSPPTCVARASRPPTSSRSPPAAGIKGIRIEGEVIATNMGPWRLARPGPRRRRTASTPSSTSHGCDEPVVGPVRRHGQPAHRRRPARGESTSSALDLPRAPDVAPSPRTAPTSSSSASLGDRHIAMRVHERGVGETRSCGTGVCAAALATSFWAGDAEPTRRLDRRRARRTPAGARAARPRGRAGRPCRPRRRRHRGPRRPLRSGPPTSPHSRARSSRPPGSARPDVVTAPWLVGALRPAVGRAHGHADAAGCAVALRMRYSPVTSSVEA